MPIINQIQKRIEETQGVETTIIDASDKVWIHIILKSDASESEVKESLKSENGNRLNFECSYKIGNGFLKSGRTVLKTHI